MITTPPPIRIGISACLMGQPVRYDSGHKHDPFLTETVGRFVEFIPVCPEVELGLGVPRETIHLTRAEGGVRLVAPKSGRDLTAQMAAYTVQKTAALERMDLSGFILKKDSPSCGMERVKVHSDGRPPVKTGRGLFAQGLMERFPLLPVEEEGRLQDPALRENFFVRIFAHRRMKDLFAGVWRPADLMEFHAREKYLLMAHNPTAYAALGRAVAGVKKTPRDEMVDGYARGFMAALATPAEPKRVVNALQHMAGYFKTALSTDDKQELAGLIDDFRNGVVPLLAPVLLIKHHARRLHVSYLEGQTMLTPHPKELMLRNHV